VSITSNMSHLMRCKRILQLLNVKELLDSTNVFLET